MGFHLAVAAVNANQATARSRSLPEAVAELIFRKELAIEMMENTIGVTNVPRQVASRRVNAAVLGHEFKTKPVFAGVYNSRTGKFKKIKKKYGETQCATCKKRCRTYCACCMEKNMCRDCYLEHYKSL